MSTPAPIAVVLLHVSDDPADVARAANSASTLLASDPTLRVRVIVNGPALAGTVSDAPAVHTGPGVLLQACATGLRRRNIAVGDLQPGVETVDSAVVALVQAQQAGASYVRI